MNIASKDGVFMLLPKDYEVNIAQDQVKPPSSYRWLICFLRTVVL